MDTESPGPFEKHMANILVSTISIQKWILKADDHVIRPYRSGCFNNIDPEVDTESFLLHIVVPHLMCFNNIDPEVDTERLRSSSFLVNQESFNNIDPEVDTESFGVPLENSKNDWFQQYRSRSGY